jgi:hypothetical protein
MNHALKKGRQKSSIQHAFFVIGYFLIEIALSDRGLKKQFGG